MQLFQYKQKKISQSLKRLIISQFKYKSLSLPLIDLIKSNVIPNFSSQRYSLSTPEISSRNIRPNFLRMYLAHRQEVTCKWYAPEGINIKGAFRRALALGPSTAPPSCDPIFLDNSACAPAST